MRYEGYSTKERVDDVLDKISKYGISTLTKLEKEFLDAHTLGNESEVHKRITKEEFENVFEDDSGYFKFEYESMKDFGDEKHFIGILYVPDLELTKTRRLDGRLEGKIIKYKNGQIIPEFDSPIKNGESYDVLEFCNGLEHELDSFLDYIISEIDN